MHNERVQYKDGAHKSLFAQGFHEIHLTEFVHMSERRLGELFAGAGDLGALAAHAERMSGLTAALREALGPELAPHLVAATLDEDGRVLSLVADSPAWASRLRFAGREILAAVTTPARRPQRCRVRVSPPRDEPRPSGRDAARSRGS